MSAAVCEEVVGCRLAMLCGPAVREVPSLAYCCSKQGALLAAWEAKMLVYRVRICSYLLLHGLRAKYCTH